MRYQWDGFALLRHEREEVIVEGTHEVNAGVIAISGTGATCRRRKQSGVGALLAVTCVAACFVASCGGGSTAYRGFRGRLIASTTPAQVEQYADALLARVRDDLEMKLEDTPEVLTAAAGGLPVEAFIASEGTGGCSRAVCFSWGGGSGRWGVLILERRGQPSWFGQCNVYERWSDRVCFFWQ